jgi:hypothetical protein
MNQPRVTDSLRKARLELEQVCRMLLRPSPEILEACEERLAKVAKEIEASRPLWREARNDIQVVGEARSVKRALQRVRRLLDTAARFHAGWRRIRAGMSGQYQSDGSLPEIRCRARIFVRG